MATRVPASVRTREELQALIDGRLGRSDERSALLRLATRLIVEEALEAEVEDALGRGYYEHGAAAGAGYRNGYRTGSPEDRRRADRLRRAAGREPASALPLGAA
jgi:putative transposase